MRISFDLLLTLEDFKRAAPVGGEWPNTVALAVTIVAVFALLWVVEYVAYGVYSFLPKDLNKKEYIVKFGRHTMDIVAMVIFTYMGFEALNGEPFHGFETIIKMNGKEVGHDRAYTFSPAAQRLCVWQVAYQAKNFVDAVIHNDGLLFLAHHVVTGVLSVSLRRVFGWKNLLCAPSPASYPSIPLQALSLTSFLHIYCAYFLGVSEISTAILCGLVLFDEDRGVPPLGKKFPVAMKITGIAFAVAFIVFRIILWPWACWYFWVDMLKMINTGKLHSVEVAYIFMTVNVLLTILQFIWLGEIITQAFKFFSEGSVAMKKGGASSDKLVDSVNSAPRRSNSASKKKR